MQGRGHREKESFAVAPSHLIPYLEDFISDFPGAIIIGMIRDPRAKIYGMYTQDIKTEFAQAEFDRRHDLPFQCSLSVKQSHVYRDKPVIQG